jgi:hypothetical protein
MIVVISDRIVTFYCIWAEKGEEFALFNIRRIFVGGLAAVFAPPRAT